MGARLSQYNLEPMRFRGEILNCFIAIHCNTRLLVLTLFGRSNCLFPIFISSEPVELYLIWDFTDGSNGRRVVILPADPDDATGDPDHELTQSGSVAREGCSLVSFKAFAEAEGIATDKTHAMYGWERLHGLQCAKIACTWPNRRELNGGKWIPCGARGHMFGAGYTKCMKEFRKRNRLSDSTVALPCHVEVTGLTV